MMRETFSYDDLIGKIRAYLGEGQFTVDPLETFGAIGSCGAPLDAPLPAQVPAATIL